MLLYIVIASLSVSLLSLFGIASLSISRKFLSRIILVLVALAAGTMIGNVFFQLLPESIELLSPETAFGIVLVSFVSFFFIEKVLHWHHCHDRDCDMKTFGIMNLVGDAVHNFVDGMVIAASFVVSVPLGIATTIAIALHEIPQEIGDFGVLLHSGYSRKKALFLNFLVALGALAGAVIGYLLIGHVEQLSSYLVPFAAGGFLYIAASDLLPEVRSETSTRKTIYIFMAFLIGVFVMYVLSQVDNGSHGHGGVEDEHAYEETVEHEEEDHEHEDEHGNVQNNF